MGQSFGEITLAICVVNTLLRCNQLFKEKTYSVDPFWKGLFVQGIKQKITTVVFFLEYHRKIGNVLIHYK